jgi:hypothetical protein
MKITKMILINNRVNNRLNQTNNPKIILTFKLKTIMKKSFGQKLNHYKHRKN